MKNKKMAVFIWVLALLPLAAVALLYTKLPELVPTQWQLGGTIRYGSKTTLWLLAGLGPVMALLFPFLRKIDPRSRNYERFANAYEGFLLVMMCFLLVMNGIVLSESLYPGRISVSKVVVLAVAVLFIYLGNMLPRVKSNFFIGIRTPWTLSDPEVWSRAQRLGGYCLFFGGLLLVPAAFLLSETLLFAFMMALVLTIALAPSVMSYLWYKQREAPQE